MADIIQILSGPHGMESRVNWTQLGRVIVARSSVEREGQ